MVSISTPVFWFMVFVGFVGWVFAAVSWKFMLDWSKEAAKLRGFISYFVDQDRVNEVLVRRALALSAASQAVIASQQQGLEDRDVANIEEALISAQRVIEEAKKDFFGPLDALAVHGRSFVASGCGSHKWYLISSGKICCESIDAFHKQIAEELEILRTGGALTS